MEAICQKICDVKEYQKKNRPRKIDNPLTQEEKELKTDDDNTKLTNALEGLLTFTKCNGCPAKGCVKCCIITTMN